MDGIQDNLHDAPYSRCICEACERHRAVLKKNKRDLVLLPRMGYGGE